MSGVYWIASYPKSGNTMVRLFLSAYRSETNDALDINHLGGLGAATTEFFDYFSGMDATELSREEIRYYRPFLYRDFALSRKEPVFVKIHDAYTSLRGKPLIPKEGTLGAAYLIRNPLDIVKSYANHSGKTVGKTIDDMGDPFYTIGKNSRRQVAQLLKSWSGNVDSWTGAKEFPVLTLRFEDLLTHPRKFYTSLIRFAGLPHDEKRLQKAIEETKFENLKKQEQKKGFIEKPLESFHFFRRGKIGGYRDELTEAQIQQIIATHRQVMTRFGYLDDRGEPVF